jgi:ADP-ribosyl-[dinitrogen reductase] hydrolase
MMTKTSLSHPLQIDAVEVPGGGLIGMTFCPGKKQPQAHSGPWDRDLGIDLAAIRDWGAELLLSLVEEHEFGEVGVVDLEGHLPEGLGRLSLPIRDYSVPDSAWEAGWIEARKTVHAILDRGGRICIHCMGGLGRTGTIAALILMERGMEATEAIAAVRAARPGAIESLQQEHYLRGR